MTSGIQVGRFVLHERLGQGSSSTVYRAWDPVMGSEVALKFLLPYLSYDRIGHERFRREARLLARVRHPNIVAFYGMEEENGQTFIVMERVIGRTLAELLAAGDGLPLDQVTRILISVGSALDYLHAEGMVHRDIKASNVMLDQAGRVLLMDLGIARTSSLSAELSSTLTAAMAGTPQTMAPEQVLGRPVGKAADIYALGVVAYQMLAGHPPFEGQAAAVMYAHVHDTPPSLRERRPGLPASVYAAVEQALDKDPALRPASAGEFVRSFLGDGQQAAASVMEQPPPPPGRDAADQQAAPLDGAAEAPAGRRRIRATLRRHLRALTLLLAIVALGGGIAAVRVLGSLGTSHAGQLVSDFELYYVGTWAQRQGTLQACFNVWARPPGGFRLQVRSEADDSPISNGDLNPPNRPGDNQCLNVDAAEPVAPGAYRAELLDGAQHQLATLPFSVVGPLTLGNIAGWAAGGAPLQGCVERGDDPGLVLQLTVGRERDQRDTVEGQRQSTDAGGSACLTAPVHSRLDPGVYRASILDAGGRELARSTFDVLANVRLNGLDGWAHGTGELQVCFDKGSGLATASLVATISHADAQGAPWTSPTITPGDAGQQCLKLASAGVIPAGSYRAAVADSLGRELLATTFSVPGP